MLLGAILVPGRRTVASLLRIMGRAQDRRFVNFHRVLNRAAWSPRVGARILLGHLMAAFAPRGVVVMGLDATIERRWGNRIRARGIYRDPVRSSCSYFVKTSGLRWLSLMLLAPISFAQRTWALAFLTALVPSARACREQGRRHKPLLEVGRQDRPPGSPLAARARPRAGGRQGGLAALAFLAALSRRGVAVVTRLRLDAAFYDPTPPRRPGTIGRPRGEGARRPTLAQVLVAKGTRWHRLTLPGWYRSRPRRRTETSLPLPLTEPTQTAPAPRPRPTKTFGSRATRTAIPAVNGSLSAARTKIQPQAVRGNFQRIKRAMLAATLGVDYGVPFIRWDLGSGRAVPGRPARP